jgi:hypothetical protein
MVHYSVKDPHGVEHIIDGPEGATPDEVIAQAQKIIPQQQQSSQPESHNTGLQKVANGISTVMQNIDQPGRMFGIKQPEVNDLYMGATADPVLDRWGNSATEYLGKKGIPGAVAAIPGTAISMANPMNWLSPPTKGIAPKTLYEPKIPAERAPIVSAAEQIGMTPTLADKTGSRFAAGVENKLSRTPFGQGPISEVYTRNAKALEANKGKLLAKYGSDADPSVVGNTIADAIEANKKPVREAKNRAFQDVYGDINVPLPEAEGKALQYIQEQDKAPSGYGNPELRTKSEGILDIKNKVSTGQNIKTGDYYGAPDNKIGYKASPMEPAVPKANYDQIKIVREGLNGLIQKETAPSGEVSPTGQRYIELKASLDRDISNFASQNTNNPLADFKAQQFAETYNAANKTSKAYAEQFKNPAINDVMALARGGHPEKIIDHLFNPKNNVSTIRKVRAAAGEEAFGLAKKAWVNDLLNKKNVALELSKKEPEMLNAIFSPEELQAIKSHGDVANLNMTAERPGMGANKSETGTMDIGMAQWGAAGSSIPSGIGLVLTGHPIAGALTIGGGVGQLLAPKYLSKAYVRLGNGIELGGARAGITRAGITTGVGSHQLYEEYLSRRRGGNK